MEHLCGKYCIHIHADNGEEFKTCFLPTSLELFTSTGAREVRKYALFDLEGAERAAAWSAQKNKFCDLCFPLFAPSEVNITYCGKKSDYTCIPFGMSLTLVYTEHSHAAIAGQTQYQLCMLKIVPQGKVGVGFAWSQKVAGADIMMEGACVHRSGLWQPSGGRAVPDSSASGTSSAHT